MVSLASVAIVIMTLALTGPMEEFKLIGRIIGTLVSAFFLILIGIINLMVFISIYKVFRRIHKGGE